MDIATATLVITTGVAALVAIITLRQWLTDRARLKHELFDRRYAIYEKIAAFPANIAITGTIDAGADIKLLRDTRLAYFVFGCDNAVETVVYKLYNLAVDLHAAQAELPGLSGADRADNINSQTKIKLELSDISRSLPNVFTKYLKLGH